MKVVILSDTHGHERLSCIDIPDGDVLIHCGDICKFGNLDEVAQFNERMALLPHRHKLLVAGNHDWPLYRQAEEARALLTAVTYLQDEQVVIDGLVFYGSPWMPEFNCWSFMLPRCSDELKAKRDAIPDKVDVLITHCPPEGILDFDYMFRSVGCSPLRYRVDQIAPKVHCFGHVHEARGSRQQDGTIFINATIVNKQMQLVHKPVVIEL